MSVRYEVRRDLAVSGWTVYDVSTGEPARWKGVLQTSLSAEDADDLADLLNRLDRIHRGSRNRFRPLPRP